MINWLINNMSDDWAKCVRIGIDKYQKEVVPYIKDGLFDLAVATTWDSIILLEEGLRYMPREGATNMYTHELLARFRVLYEYCRQDLQDKKEKEGKVRDAMERIEEKMSLVEIGINSVLRVD